MFIKPFVQKKYVQVNERNTFIQIDKQTSKEIKKWRTLQHFCCFIRQPIKLKKKQRTIKANPKPTSINIKELSTSKGVSIKLFKSHHIPDQPLPRQTSSVFWVQRRGRAGGGRGGRTASDSPARSTSQDPCSPPRAWRADPGWVGWGKEGMGVKEGKDERERERGNGGERGKGWEREGMRERGWKRERMRERGNEGMGVKEGKDERERKRGKEGERGKERKKERKRFLKRLCECWLRIGIKKTWQRK